ncbi:MAG: hypothetical protein IPK79_11870 [Vampirovibrionales bacterium]|nr:hypothetical protein [Vampirovibrionales bacterium]
MTMQTPVKTKNIAGIFSEDVLNSLYQELQQRHVPADQISILMSENTGNKINVKDGNKAPEGATIGGLSGAAIGAIIGGLTLVGSVLLPGVGLLAAGPLVGALAGTAAGASAGGLLGGLIGLGVPEHEAKVYEDALKQEGNMMVAVQASEEMVPELKALFERHQGKAINIS